MLAAPASPYRQAATSVIVQRMRGPAHLSGQLQCGFRISLAAAACSGSQRRPLPHVRQRRYKTSPLSTADIQGTSQQLRNQTSAQQDTSLIQECSTANWNTPLADHSVLDGPVSVALGKFDAMHQGHRLLAERAAASGAHPYLLSFSGMAEVLGWPARLPLVASCDRAQVLASWKPFCHGRTPRQRYIPFSMVRNLSPEAFVKVLAEDLQVSGVVVGQNYRFG